MSKTKQVLVVRSDLKMRKGKIGSQCGHASMMFLTKRLKPMNMGQDNNSINIKDVEQDWLDNSFTKICTKVNSEEELDLIYDRAKLAGLEVHMVIDNGATEFNGVKTKTCICIGPNYSEDIDAVTGEAGPLGRLALY